MLSPVLTSPIPLRTRYAVYGTGIGYPATHLLCGALYAMCLHDLPCCLCYLPTRCAVLSHHMVYGMRGTGTAYNGTDIHYLLDGYAIRSPDVVSAHAMSGTDLAQSRYHQEGMSGTDLAQCRYQQALARLGAELGLL
eukprot:241464-Rhodomonas_salina.3